MAGLDASPKLNSFSLITGFASGTESPTLYSPIWLIKSEPSFQSGQKISVKETSSKASISAETNAAVSTSPSPA